MKASWRKSSYSGDGGSNCIEVGNASAAVLVRDTQDRSGPALNVPAEVWRKFTAGIKNGR